MATETETVVAPPTADPVDEKIEKIVDEVKAVEEESSTPCKDIGEEDSIKVEESQLVTSILAKLEEEEVAPKLESPAIETKTEDETADEENDQIEPIPESQIPEDIKAVDPPPAECVEKLIEDGSEPVDVAAPAVEAEPEEKASAVLPAELESEEPAIAEVRDILEPAENPVISIEPPADSVERGQEYDDQPITDPQVQGGLLADNSAEKEQDDQPSVESVIKKEEQPGLTSVERELDNKPSMEAVIKEEEEGEHLTIAPSEKEQGEQQLEECVLKEAEEKPSLVSSEKEQEEQPLINLVTKEAEDQLVVGSVEKTPEDQPLEEQEEQPLINLVTKEAEDQLAVGSVEKNPEDQPLEEQEEQPSINLVTKEAEDQLAVGSVEKNPEDQPLAEPTVEGVEDQPEVDQEDQPSLSANSIPASDVECKPTIETEQPVSILPGEELEPAIVKETTYSDSGATESEPTTTTKTEQPEPVQPGEELEPAIVKETTYSNSPATNVEAEPTTTIEMEQPEPVLPGEELEPVIVKETTYSDSGATNVESEPTTTTEMEQPVPVLPEEDLEAAIVKETADSESGAINDENPQQEAARLDDKQTEQFQNTDEVCEPQKDVATETVKDERILAVDAENTTMVKEDVCKEVKEIGNSEEERVEQSESAGGDDPTPPVPESIKEEVNEPSTVEIVEKLPKDVVLTDEKSSKEDEETTVKTGEGNKETEGVIGQVTTVEDVGSSLPTAIVAKISTDEERSCQEVDLIAENKIEDVKDENATVTETSESVDNITTVTGDTKEVNTERSVELSTEETADADQITKLDLENQEPSTKESDESKSSENQEKEVPSKPAHKHSNNILSKVKQSLVKAKKAIIGKSPGSKNLPSETKGDIQVK